LKFFKEIGEISTSEYMKRYNVSERTARYDLSELAEKNLISKQGEKKQTKYIFADKLPINKFPTSEDLNFGGINHLLTCPVQKHAGKAACLPHSLRQGKTCLQGQDKRL
jgi:hypothetical protein